MNTEIIKKRFGNEIAKMKEQHGQLTAIVVEGKIGIFKKPDRKTISLAASYATTDPIRYVEILAENCFIAGDRELLDNDDLFLSVMPKLNALIETKEAELVKL